MGGRGERRGKANLRQQKKTLAFALSPLQTHTLCLSGSHTHAEGGTGRLSLILRDSARSVLDSAQQGRRSTHRVNAATAASQSQGDPDPAQPAALPLPPPLPRPGWWGGREPAGTGC